MKRIILVLVGSYVLIAAANRVAEAAGAMRCDCAAHCWCRSRGLSLFRWVFPWRHRSAHTSKQKSALDAPRA